VDNEDWLVEGQRKLKKKLGMGAEDTKSIG